MRMWDTTMGKIVLEHYPASKLPNDLRGSIAASASVTVTVEEEPARKPLSLEELIALTKQAQARARGTTIEEAVDRIRKLRDEWDY
jgi:hypothetical protein